MAEPALRHQPHAQARRPLHAGNGVADLRHARGQVPRGLRADRLDLRAGQGADQPVRARLDAALRRLAEHPGDGDDPASARQHRRRRRGHECAARPFQHPGPDRSRPPVESDARLHGPARRLRDDLRQVHLDAEIQAAAPGADQLLAELFKILRQLPEIDVRGERDGGKQLGLRSPAEVRDGQELRHHPGVRADERGRPQRLHLPGLQSAAGLPRQGQDPAGPVEAQVPHRHGPARHRDGELLAQRRAAEPVRPRSDPDGGVPASDDLLRRGGRLPGQLGALAAMALEGGEPARLRQVRHLDHEPDLPSGEGEVRRRGRRAGRRDQCADLELYRSAKSRTRRTSPRR